MKSSAAVVLGKDMGSEYAAKNDNLCYAIVKPVLERPPGSTREYVFRYRNWLNLEEK